MNADLATVIPATIADLSDAGWNRVGRETIARRQCGRHIVTVDAGPEPRLMVTCNDVRPGYSEADIVAVAAKIAAILDTLR